MASKIITRAVAVIMVLGLLILLSSGAQAKECRVMISKDPLCFAENKDACDTWCYHKGYESGACYAGPGAGDLTCICSTPCPPKGSLSSAAEPATARA